MITLDNLKNHKVYGVILRGHTLGGMIYIYKVTKLLYIYPLYAYISKKAQI